MAHRPPPLLTQLPQQFFTEVLAAAAQARALPGPPVIDLGRGNPDLPPPAHAIAALHEAASGAAAHGYPPFQGTPALREALAARYREDHGVTLDPETEVAVVPGTKTGIMLAVLATVAAGETVLLPDPGYPDYRSAVALAGAREAALPLLADAGWQPDFDAAPDAALTVLNYPSNPCAVCAADGTLEAAVERVAARGGWLLNDFAYGFLAFDGRRARSLLAVPGAREVGVELWSASKVYGMAGWRIGFLVGNPELVGRVRTLVDHTTAGVFGAVQEGLRAALSSDQRDVAERVATYASRRERVVTALRAAGTQIAAPEGSFFAWWRPPIGLTAERLLAEQRLSVAPGEGFGARGAGWLRLSLSLPDAELDAGVERLIAAL
ncbi:MAG: Aspartate aminotransferase [uncultured Solirubrobacteraceae bacterium]|uniref:Aminotransferase n=1 Tax=uncultured Solirubrobacteraceae bacterium TaxID=1162706 RepID=A0A6J4T8X9_9ACTN|nr:MAG: Aspartate aminotransferase [uncultured Solirubrobacteraceae bacterium]